MKNSDFSGGLSICSWIYDPNTKTSCWTIYKPIIVFC